MLHRVFVSFEAPPAGIMMLLDGYPDLLSTDDGSYRGGCHRRNASPRGPRNLRHIPSCIQVLLSIQYILIKTEGSYLIVIYFNAPCQDFIFWTSLPHKFFMILVIMLKVCTFENYIRSSQLNETVVPLTRGRPNRILKVTFKRRKLTF